MEMGRDDPVLEFPWTSDDPAVKFVDLKGRPDLLSQVPEATEHPALHEFLAAVNAPESPFKTAKCDAWPEDDSGSSTIWFASYVDVLFTERKRELSLADHEAVVKQLARRVEESEVQAAAEFVVRRCFYHLEGNGPEQSEAGCCITCYVRGCGDRAESAYANWASALAMVCEALRTARLPRSF